MVRCLTLLVTAACASHEETWHEETWAQLWLHYDPVSSSYAKKISVPEVICPGSASEAPILGRACDEIVTGLTGLLRTAPERTDTVSEAGSLVLDLTTDGQRASTADMAWPPSHEADGYSIAATTRNRVPVTLINASSHRGLLYGVFRYLHLVRTEDVELHSPSFHVTSIPSNPLRMWNLWDNQDETIERGYAGNSVFEWGELPTLRPRYTDYARLLASVGINAIVWDNVNACKEPNIPLLESAHIQNFASLAGLFAEFGIWTFFVPCFSDPIQIGSLQTADPVDGEVVKWWYDKVSELKAAMPAFRGFLVKADSEGQPGPNTYGRTELDGANMLGEALAPAEAIVIWRCFAHPIGEFVGMDQALFQYEQYVKWDGQFHPNVVLQAKNGPVDFQVREPVHALFGRMTNTNFILELQASQEYLGQAKHMVHLPAQWDYYLSWDTGVVDETGASQTLAQYVSGRGTHQVYTGVAAVSNVGRDVNWVGHEMSAANTYGFGRLAWSPDLHAKTITEEWVKATWGVDAEVVSCVTAMLLESWEAFENYTSPLGAGMISGGNHHDMDPGLRQGPKYLNATKHAVGNDRWKGFGQKYLEPMSSKLGTPNPDDCPDDLLLSFHHVPYDYKLKGKGGMSVIDYIYGALRTGAAKAAAWPAQWECLEGRVVEGAYGAGAFAAVAQRLHEGSSEAGTFSRTVTTWFEATSGIPAPEAPLWYTSALVPEQERSDPGGGGGDALAEGFCCSAARDAGDTCGTCWECARLGIEGYCGASRENCESCAKTWCAGGGGGGGSQDVLRAFGGAGPRAGAGRASPPVAAVAAVALLASAGLAAWRSRRAPRGAAAGQEQLALVGADGTAAEA